jgi:hypothetical protein
MSNGNEIQRVLQKELEFLEKGGYAWPIPWKARLVFEDSPTCPKAKDEECPDPGCVLLGFVPEACRFEPVPCRYISLNADGETLDSLYRTGSNEEIVEAVRCWLVTTLKKHGSPGSGKVAEAA